MIGVAGRAEGSEFKDWGTSRQVDAFDHITDPDGEVWREYGITGQPAFIFLNDDGTELGRTGALGLDGLTERVNELVAA